MSIMEKAFNRLEKRDPPPSPEAETSDADATKPHAAAIQKAVSKAEATKVAEATSNTLSTMPTQGSERKFDVEVPLSALAELGMVSVDAAPGGLDHLANLSRR